MPSTQAIRKSRKPDIPPTPLKTLQILLPGFAVFIPVALLIFGLLAQILLRHKFYFTSGSLVTTAPLGTTLVIAHACSTVVTITLPFVIGLEAYRLSRTWLAASRVGGDNRPTPFQLCVLMSVLNRANIASLWAGITCMLGSRSSKQGQALRKPRMLRNAVALLFFLLTLAYSCVAFETWLGISSQTIPFPQNTAFEGSLPPMTRQMNQTLCTTVQSSPLPLVRNLCGIITGGSGPSPANAEGIRTLTNTSILNAVAFSDDQIAMVIPPTSQIRDDMEFVAQTFGVKTTCQTITSLCVNNNVTFNPSLAIDPGIIISCPTSAHFNASSGTSPPNFPFGILDDAGNMLNDFYQGNASHFRFGAVVKSFAYTQIVKQDQLVGNTGFFDSKNNFGAYNVLSCDVNVLSVVYQYFQGNFTTLTNSNADVNMTHRIAASGVGNVLSTHVPNAVEGSGLFSGDYAQAFALELSREFIALSAHIYEPAAPLELHTVQPTIGSQLQLVPLVLLLAALCVYCLTVFILVVLAAIGKSSSTYVLLARNWLIDPLTIYHSAFDDVDAQRTWEESPKQLFGDEGEADRLNVGPTFAADGTVAFGVSKVPPPVDEEDK